MGKRKVEGRSGGDTEMFKELHKLGRNWCYLWSTPPLPQPSHPVPKVLKTRILSWNIRGCNSLLKKILLKRKVEIEKPTIVFLQETKCSEEQLKKVSKKSWRSCEVIVMDATRAVGGLGILWDPKVVSLDEFRATHFHISAAFHILGTGIRGTVSNIYGPSMATNKECFLDSLN